MCKDIKVNVSEVDFDKGDGLVPAVVQDAESRCVLMLGYMNKEALERTLKSGRVTFYSRSRQCLWEKGETSGHWLEVREIRKDCDADALLVKVKAHGAVCHTGADTCWGEVNVCGTQRNGTEFLTELQDFIDRRRKEMPDGSYTTSLFRAGVNRMGQKVGEEALETVIEAVNGSKERMVYEAADMMYHLIVLLSAKGLRVEDVVKELEGRHAPGWRKK